MKQLALILGLTLFSIVSLANDPEGIRFEPGSWKEISAKARKENKLIFIDCYTSWCGPCKRLSSDIFPLKNVGEYFNNNFISYKVDMEKGEGIGLSKQFHVGVYPTLLWVDYKGNIVHRVVGFMKEDKLLAEAQLASGGGTYKVDLEAGYKKNMNDPKAVEAYLNYLINSGDTREKGIALHFLSIIPKERYLEQSIYRLIAKHVRSPFSTEVNYINEHRALFDEKFNRDQVEHMLNEKYSMYANYLVSKVKDGGEFDETAFQNLIGLMKARNFVSEEQVAHAARIKVLEYKKDWKAYAAMINLVIEKGHYKDIDARTFRDWYNPVVAGDCNDEEVLVSALHWIDKAFEMDGGFGMAYFSKYWVSKISLLERMKGKTEALIKARAELSLLTELESKQNAYNAKQAERTRILKDLIDKQSGTLH